MGIKSFFKRALGRGFTAANINRHTADWIVSPLKTNEELKQSLMLLILRSRDLAKNNSYMRKYISLRADNIIGPSGFSLQMRIKNDKTTQDKIANDTIENAWYQWGRLINKSAVMDGSTGFIEFCRLVDKTLAIDGEAFIQIIKGAANPWGFSLRMIDTLDVDIMYNVDTLTNSGNRIIMGVEMDANNKPLAYWTRETTQTYYGGERKRIPAENIIHLFEKEFVGQARGIPHTVAAIMDLNQLNGYREAELIGARIGACQMGIWKRVQGTIAAKLLGDNPASEGMKESYDMEPGAFMKAPSGYELQQLNPTHPGGNFESFIKSTLRCIAGSLGVSYNLFASDLETVNFSSLRSGALTERDTWTTKQNFFIENFVEIIFKSWLEMFLLSGQSTLPFSKFDKFHQPEFRGRRWAWVDPRADTAAASEAMDKKIKSPQEIILETGRDPETVLDDFQAWNEMLKKRELTIQPIVNGMINNNGVAANGQV